MRDSILQKIFRRVQISRSEGIVLDAILSKANLYGKHARVAYECLAGDHRAFPSGMSNGCQIPRSLRRATPAGIKQVLWPGHNAINVYRCGCALALGKSAYQEMGSGRPTRQDKQNNKGDSGLSPKHPTKKKNPLPPLHVCALKGGLQLADARYTPLVLRPGLDAAPEKRSKKATGTVSKGWTLAKDVPLH